MSPKELIEEVIKKTAFLNYKFTVDRATVPSIEQISFIKEQPFKIRVSVLHYGQDNDHPEGEYSWLTHISEHLLEEWNEKAIAKIFYKALLAKFRHEASELFTFEGDTLFNEHYVEPVKF